MQKIQYVKAGQKITASKVNELISHANIKYESIDDSGNAPGESIDNLDTEFYHNWKVNEYQTKLDTEGKLCVSNPVVWTGDSELDAVQAAGVTQISGTWYAGILKNESDAGRYSKAIYTNNPSYSDYQDKYYFQKVFTILQSQQGTAQALVNPVNSIQYHNIHPSFSKSLSAANEEHGAWRWNINETIGTALYGTFTYCNYQFGRATYELDDQDFIKVPEEGDTSYTLYLNISHESPQAASVSDTSIGNSLSTTAVPLIKIDTTGKIVNDFRGMPVVPVWGTPQG